MRSRRTAQDHVAEVARRRLEQLSAELAAIRTVPVEPPPPGDVGGSGGLDPSGQPAVEEVPPGKHAHRPVGTGARLMGWLHDRLPPALSGGPALSRAHVVVLVLVVGCAVAATAWRVAAAHGDGAVTPAGSAAATPATSGPAALVTPASPPRGGATAGAGPAKAGSATAGAAATAGATSPSAGTVVVDVTGKVRRPGIATLPSGSRVVDALRAAGGARHGAALGSLNLARVLTDGEQVVVGVRPAGGAAAAAVGTPAPGGSGAAAGASPAPMVDVNTADQTTLEQLPGIGPVTARSILDYRAENGPFASVDDLLGVSGIGDATLAKLAPYVTL